MADKTILNTAQLITATIVLYKEDVVELVKTIDSFLVNSFPKRLFLIDNSPTDVLRSEFTHPDIEYLYVGENVGFAKGHNKVLNKINNLSNYHLVLNPDVVFDPIVIPTLVNVLEKEPNLALIAPKVVFPDGKHQYSCRKFPSFWELILRRVSILNAVFPSIIKKGEYRDIDLSEPFNPDFIHGCFLLFKTKNFIKLKGFDERFFLYMEDVDICRKLDKQGLKKLYYPKVEIVHVLKKRSLKNIKLFAYHTISVFQYFYKWKRI